MSLFKRKKAGEEANTIPEAMDDITQTLLIPVKDEGAKTMCADAYETSQAEIASYTSIEPGKASRIRYALILGISAQSALCVTVWAGLQGANVPALWRRMG